MTTFQQLADERLPKDSVYDWAMPQEWFNQASEVSGANPSGHVVWLYPPRSICGHPCGLTLLGWIIIKLMNLHNQRRLI